MRTNQERIKIERLTSKISDLIELRDSRLSELKQELKSRKRSSDPIKDFTTVWFNNWKEETTAPYKDLAKQAQENIGNYVLILKQTRIKDEPMIHHLSSKQMGCFPQPEFYTTDSIIKIGKLIKDLKFDISKGSLIFPTKKHLQTKVSSFDGDNLFYSNNLDLENVSGSIVYSCEELPHLWTKAIGNLYARFSFDSTSRILFGDDIKSFFEKNLDKQNNYQRIEELLK